MQDALQNLNVPERSVSPILQVQVEQENEEEEEEEGTVERVRLSDVLHPGMMIDSLNSSYEDLAGEGIPVRQVPILAVPVLPSSQHNEAKEKVDGSGSGQDANSEADNPNDSSGEEDAGTGMRV